MSASAGKRILLVLHEPPLPFGGAAARWYYVLLRGLVQRGHSVTAFAPTRDPAEADAAGTLFPSPQYDLRLHPLDSPGGILSRFHSARRPFSYPYTSAMRADVLNEMKRGYDAVHLEQLWTGWLNLEHFNRVIVNTHYLFALDWSGRAPGCGKQWLIGTQALRVERRLVCRYHNLACLTPQLAGALSQMNPNARVWTVPMALDLSLYEFREPPIDRAGPPTIGLIGSFNWIPTVNAAVRLITRIWPGIRSRVPNARLLIVGRSARTALAEHLNSPGVEVMENVPDVVPCFRDLDVMIYAPEAASGMKVKVMEAFALGVPVVTNSHGVEGLAVRDNVHAMIGDADDSLIAAAGNLLSDGGKRQLIARAARNLLETELHPADAVEKWSSVYEQMG